MARGTTPDTEHPDPRAAILSRPLSPRQQAFAHALAAYGSAAQAAREAGYTVKHGDRLSRDPRVKGVVAKLQAERLARLELDAATLDRETLAIATSDIATVCTWDRDGVYPLPSHLLPATATAAIRKLSTTRHGVTIELHPKLDAVKLLLQRLGLLQGQDLQPAARPVDLPKADLDAAIERLTGGQARPARKAAKRAKSL